jgi:hypothetical protein
MKIPLVESMIAASCETSFEAIEREESERSFSDIYFFLFCNWVRCIPHCPPEGAGVGCQSLFRLLNTCWNPSRGPRHNPQAPAGISAAANHGEWDAIYGFVQNKAQALLDVSFYKVCDDQERKK